MRSQTPFDKNIVKAFKELELPEMATSSRRNRKILVSDRDSTLVDKKNNVINPDAILDIIKEIDTQPNYSWAIASAGGSELKADHGFLNLKKQLKTDKYHDLQKEPGYVVFNRSSTLCRLVQTGAHIVVKSNQKKHTQQEKAQLAMECMTQCENFELGKEIDFKGCQIKIEKNAEFIVKFGETLITIQADKFNASLEGISSGDFKLFHIFDALNQAKLYVKPTNELKALGIVKITAPRDYKKINPEDIIFLDDRKPNCAIIEKAGFTAIHADTYEAKEDQGKNTYLEHLSSFFPPLTPLDHIKNALIESKAFDYLDKVMKKSLRWRQINAYLIRIKSANTLEELEIAVKDDPKHPLFDGMVWTHETSMRVDKVIKQNALSLEYLFNDLKNFYFPQHREQQSGLCVLSDIDDTLLIRDEKDHSLWRINDNLINAWIAKGIKEITLITNTGLGDLERLYQYVDDPERRNLICLEYDPNNATGYGCIPRPVIVDYLKAKGFTVNAILSGADIHHNQGPGRAYADLVQKDYDDALDYAQGVLKKRPEFKREGHPFEINKQAMDTHYQTLSADDAKLDAKALPFTETDKAKAIAKAKVIKYALENHPEDLFTTDIICSDDEELSLKLVNKQFVTKAPDYHFSAYEVRQKWGEAESQKHYETIINNAQSETVRAKSTPRPVALLDIDDTLINADGTYNDELLKALMDEEITDVILFTDMTFRTGNMGDRNKVIDYLNEKGFTVHAVSTPLDYLWHADDKILRDFNKAWDKSGINLSNMQTPEKLQENLEKLDLLLKKHPQVEALINDESIPPYGGAFNEAKNLYKKHSKELAKAHDKPELEQKLFTQVRDKSSHVKIISDIISLKRGIKHVKGMMFEQIIEHMPDWVNGIVHVDDRRDALDAVMEAAEKSNLPILPVKTIYVPSNSFNNPAGYYRGHLSLSAEESVRLTVSPQALQNQMDNIANAFQENDIDQAIYHLFSLNVTLEKIKLALGLNDKADWNNIFTEIYPKYYPELEINDDDENNLSASCICLNHLIHSKLANCKSEDKRYYTVLSKMMGVFTGVAKIAMPEDSEKVPEKIINQFDCQTSVIKHLSMKTPIESVLVKASSFFSNKNQVKQKLFKCQTEHAKEIFEAQMTLFHDNQPSNLLEEPKLNASHVETKEEKKRQARVAYHFLKNIQEVIFTTQWVVSDFSGIKLYSKKEDGKKREFINTVPPNMAAMADVIKLAFRHDPHGTNDIIWLRAFNDVAAIGKKAAIDKPFFGTRDQSVQAFYDQFLNFYKNSRTFVNNRKR